MEERMSFIAFRVSSVFNGLEDEIAFEVFRLYASISDLIKKVNHLVTTHTRPLENVVANLNAYDSGSTFQESLFHTMKNL
jgi:hypothetical protein